MKIYERMCKMFRFVILVLLLVSALYGVQAQETDTQLDERPTLLSVFVEGTVNIRSGPGTAYSKVGVAKAGERFEVVALALTAGTDSCPRCKGSYSWEEIRYGDGTAFIADHLTQVWLDPRYHPDAPRQTRRFERLANRAPRCSRSVATLWILDDEFPEMFREDFAHREVYGQIAREAPKIFGTIVYVAINSDEIEEIDGNDFFVEDSDWMKVLFDEDGLKRSCREVLQFILWYKVGMRAAAFFEGFGEQYDVAPVLQKLTNATFALQELTGLNPLDYVVPERWR